jgi:hypothetical protein
LQNGGQIQHATLIAKINTPKVLYLLFNNSSYKLTSNKTRMDQIELAEDLQECIELDDKDIGLSMSGSWLTKEINDYSESNTLKCSIPTDKKQSIVKRLINAGSLFKYLIASLYDNTIQLQNETEKRIVSFSNLRKMKSRNYKQ